MCKKTCKDCLHCTVDGDEVLCVDMPWHYPFGGQDRTELDKEACKHFLERDKPTLFDQITKTPETLAPNFVVEIITEHLTAKFVVGYRSTIIPGKIWKTETEAITATVAKLKESQE